MKRSVSISLRFLVLLALLLQEAQQTILLHNYANRARSGCLPKPGRMVSWKGIGSCK
jgi:hypothetical protein